MSNNQIEILNYINLCCLQLKPILHLQSRKWEANVQNNHPLSNSHSTIRSGRPMHDIIHLSATCCLPGSPLLLCSEWLLVSLTLACLCHPECSQNGLDINYRPAHATLFSSFFVPLWLTNFLSAFRCSIDVLLGGVPDSPSAAWAALLHHLPYFLWHWPHCFEVCISLTCSTDAKPLEDSWSGLPSCSTRSRYKSDGHSVYIHQLSMLLKL